MGSCCQLRTPDTAVQKRGCAPGASSAGRHLRHSILPPSPLVRPRAALAGQAAGKTLPVRVPGIPAAAAAPPRPGAPWA